jgi:hypothetical protein
VESLERRKEAMIASLWANSNYDDDKGTRRSAIEEIERNFAEAQSAEEEIDYENPFFGAVKEGEKRLASPSDVDGSVSTALLDQQNYSKYIDQD